MHTRRRTFLTVAGGTVAALAGCLGGDDDGNGSDADGNGTDDGTDNGTDNGSDNGTDNGGDNGTDNGSDNGTDNGGDNGTDNGSDNGTDNGNDSDGGPETVTGAIELLVEEMAAGQFDEAYQQFSEQARQATSPGALEALWLGLTAVGGSFEEIVDTEETYQGGFDAADATLGFERSEHVLRVIVDSGFTPRSVIPNDEYRRPGYVDPEAFETREVTLEPGNCLLEGAVTVPEESPATENGEVPGVVLVHGSDSSGTADMDLSTVGSKIFKDLGEGLATEGVAVLRYDRRTYACPNSVPPAEYTLDAVSVDDALVAVERLREAEGVDPDRVVVVGHSLGGMAVPRIAQRDGNLAGAIPMAAPARSFHEVFVDQFEHLANLGDYEWEQMQAVFEEWSDRIDRIREGDYQPGDTVLGYPGALWDSVGDYDHIGTAKSIDTPLRFLQGERDYQVTVEDDFATWQSELADRPATTFQQYEGLNHLFQYGEGPSVQIEFLLRNHVDNAVMTDIADWVGSL